MKNKPAPRYPIVGHPGCLERCYECRETSEHMIVWSGSRVYLCDRHAHALMDRLITRVVDSQYFEKVDID